MSGLFKKAILYIKQVEEFGLFALMSNSRLYIALSESPIMYVSLPFLGLLFTILTIIKGFELAKANNKNFDKLFDFTISFFCAILSSISLYGAALSIIYEFTFAAGPWFFLGSAALAAAHQLVMHGLNVFRAYESLSGSTQRMHYIQAAINNSFVFGLLVAVTGSAYFVMLTPIAPAVGTAFALTAAGFTALNVMWQITPNNWKLFIKELFYLGKPGLSQQEQTQPSPDFNFCSDASASVEVKHHRLFTHCDYSAEVRARELKSGEVYLQGLICRKITLLQNNFSSAPAKNSQKEYLLTNILSALKNHTEISSKTELLKQYPLAFQSFWAEKGEVEQLFDAALVLFEKRKLKETAKEIPDCDFNPQTCGI